MMLQIRIILKLFEARQARGFELELLHGILVSLRVESRLVADEVRSVREAVTVDCLC